MIVSPDSGTCGTCGTCGEHVELVEHVWNMCGTCGEHVELVEHVEPAVSVSHQSSQSSEEIFRVLSENTKVLYQQHLWTCQEHVKNMLRTHWEHVRNTVDIS